MGTIVSLYVLFGIVLFASLFWVAGKSDSKKDEPRQLSPNIIVFLYAVMGVFTGAYAVSCFMSESWIRTTTYSLISVTMLINAYRTFRKRT